MIKTSNTKCRNGERGTGIDFKATASIKKQTCINIDKEIGEYVVDIKAYSMVVTNPLQIIAITLLNPPEQISTQIFFR